MSAPYKNCFFDLICSIAIDNDDGGNDNNNDNNNINNNNNNNSNNKIGTITYSK